MASKSHQQLNVAPCRNFASSGNCDFGSRCRYSHESIWRIERPPPNQTPCFHWEETRACPYGERCAYAHNNPHSGIPINDGLGDEVCTLERFHESEAVEPFLLVDFRELASYDWLVAESPTIGVPGNPRQFEPPTLPLRLQPDVIAFDNTTDNAALAEPFKFRYEPLAQACLTSKPDTCFKDVQFISALHNLRKLLSFAIGSAEKAFRIDLEHCEQSILMTRWEEKPVDLTHTSPSRGYGKGFEQVCTRQEAGMMQPTSHHRVVSYSLREIKLVVQFEADAYDCHCAKRHIGDVTTVLRTPRVLKNVTRKDHAYQDAIADPTSASLEVVDIGTTHRSACLVEIKSRHDKNNDLGDIFAQSWLMGEPRLYLGRHIRGYFRSQTVGYQDISHDIAEWQKQNAEGITIFLAILRRVRVTILQLALEGCSTRYALTYEPDKDSGMLKLWQREGGQEMLRAETIEALWRRT